MIFQIDSNKLRKAIEKKGITGSEASKLIGRASNYFSDCYRRSAVNSATKIAIENILHIPYDEYKYEEPVKEIDMHQVNDETQVNNVFFDYSKLEEIIYKGVLRALKEGL